MSLASSDERPTAKLLARIDLLGDVLARDTVLRRVTKKGEYVGACPWCGGDDRFHVWTGEEPQRYWCRGCERKGNAIDYLMHHDGLAFREAFSYLQELAEGRPPADRTQRADRGIPPPSAWQQRAGILLKGWQEALRGDEGEKARTWLHQRGLTDATLRYWGVGFNPAPTQNERGDLWGMQPDTAGNIPAVFIAHGIALPWWDGTHNIWGLRIRTSSNAPGGKYRFISGSHPFLFGAGTRAWIEQPTIDALVLTEGEFDCMLAWQEAGDLATFATLGSAAIGQIDTPALLQLLRARYIITAFDTDQAGRNGSAQIASQIAGRIAHQSAPPAHDLTDYHRTGGNLRAWIGATICEGLYQAIDRLNLADDDAQARLMKRIIEIDALAKLPRQPDTPQAA